MTKSSSVSPIGLKLVEGKPYIIGPLLGSGEFGAVYAINTESSTKNQKEWVVKVVAKPTKVSKKQNTPSELAYGMLWKEKLLYNIQFQSLCDTYIPKFPRKSMNDGLDLFLDHKQGMFYVCLVLIIIRRNNHILTTSLFLVISSISS